ncbi:MAG: hypothetical protein OXI40_14180 [Chloroflexota bacterium]|nr:hypothetical protein [Chloroflexota bacterium]
MAKIERIYLISNTHTDIGYTDHQDTVFRQHLGFIDQAIELGEATADYPEEARYKWTCEATSFVERYFQERPASQIDRFLAISLDMDDRRGLVDSKYNERREQCEAAARWRWWLLRARPLSSRA